MRAAVLCFLVASAPVVAGCLEGAPEAREVGGPTEGYAPTPRYLKVHVRADDDRLVALDFDRRDWHVAAIAERLDRRELPHLTAVGAPRLMNEYVVARVAAPDDLQALRYEAMGATPEQRARMDAAYDDVLRRVAGDVRLP